MVCSGVNSLRMDLEKMVSINNEETLVVDV